MSSCSCHYFVISVVQTSLRHLASKHHIQLDLMYQCILTTRKRSEGRFEICKNVAKDKRFENNGSIPALSLLRNVEGDVVWERDRDWTRLYRTSCVCKNKFFKDSYFVVVYSKWNIPQIQRNSTFSEFMKGVSSGTSRTVTTLTHSHLPQNCLHAVGN